MDSRGTDTHEGSQELHILYIATNPSEKTHPVSPLLCKYCTSCTTKAIFKLRASCGGRYSMQRKKFGIVVVLVLHIIKCTPTQEFDSETSHCRV